MSTAEQRDNPLLTEWPGRWGGVPPFDRVRVEDFEPALEAGMAEKLAHAERIAAHPEPATFENTLEALERSGTRLDEVRTLFSVWSSNLSSPQLREVELRMAPRFAAFADRITQNEALFRRIESVYEAREHANLSPEQQRLTWLYYTNFVRAGARLDAAAKQRLTQINQRLAELFTRFSQNLLADESEQFLVVRDEGELAGVPDVERKAAAEAAAARGQGRGWLFPNTRSVIEPLLTYAARRELRERAFRMFVNRGDNGGRTDNNPIIAEILQLRAERAKLLGYASHAHWRLENSMAGTPERALELMQAVWVPAVAAVHAEVAAMQELAQQDGLMGALEPWDYRYYAEKVHAARFDVDQDEVKQYLELEQLVQAMFWVAGELFGYRFEPLTDVPVYHPDVRVWEVREQGSGRAIGLFYFDPYAREGKHSGAWMNAYRRQHRLGGEVLAIVSNNSNFVPARPGEPALISWIDATTLFHEFGHALHGLASAVTYPALSGTSVPRDYVEFPSQLLEHWLYSPQVLERFARHHRTGEPIPLALVERIERAAQAGQGFATTEYLACALLDMKLHLRNGGPIDPRHFEREALAELGMPREVVMRHRTPQFSHIFSGDGYSAGYYSYLWADVLVADAVEAFHEAGGLFDAGVAERLRENVLARGNSLDPADAFRAFRGRDPQVAALMRKRGFSG